MVTAPFFYASLPYDPISSAGLPHPTYPKTCYQEHVQRVDVPSLLLAPVQLVRVAVSDDPQQLPLEHRPLGLLREELVVVLELALTFYFS